MVKNWKSWETIEDSPNYALVTNVDEEQSMVNLTVWHPENQKQVIYETVVDLSPVVFYKLEERNNKKSPYEKWIDGRIYVQLGGDWKYFLSVWEQMANDENECRNIKYDGKFIFYISDDDVDLDRNFTRCYENDTLYTTIEAQNHMDKFEIMCNDDWEIPRLRNLKENRIKKAFENIKKSMGNLDDIDIMGIAKEVF